MSSLPIIPYDPTSTSSDHVVLELTSQQSSSSSFTPTTITLHNNNNNDITCNNEGYKKFQHAKYQCLYSTNGKRDKSSVGQIDVGVIEICNLINTNFQQYYTTSSCNGRCFLYTGTGNKSSSSSTTNNDDNHNDNTFQRCRISHTIIQDPKRYFNLSTLVDDPTGGGDIIPQIYDGGKRQRQLLRRRQQKMLQQQMLQQPHQEGNEGRGDSNDNRHPENDNAIDEDVGYENDNDDDDDDDDNDDDADNEMNPKEEQDTIIPNDNDNNNNDDVTNNNNNNTQKKKVWWIRYEPFILHVACRSLHSAIQFMNIIRPIFKTVGITSLSDNNNNNNNNNTMGCPKYVVAIYGDEGLDMPLTNEYGISMVHDSHDNNDNNENRTNNNDDDDNDHSTSRGYSSCWLASLINERHERNTNKIQRLVQAIRNAINNIHDDNDNTEYMTNSNTDEYNYTNGNNSATTTTSNPTMFVNMNGQQIRIPRSYDVIGDVAILHTLPSINNNNNNVTTTTTTNTDDSNINDETKYRKIIGEAIIQRNKNIKVVVLRSSNLDGNERAPGINGIQILTGPIDRIQRLPLITTHREYGISCVVNIHNTFFSPRMQQERVRICEQIIEQQQQQSEHVLVLFAGVCMDAFQIVARTNVLSVTAIESNDYAYECAKKGHVLLQRNKQCLHTNAAKRLQILHGNCLDIIPTLPIHHYHRILAPRPKEGNLDGDQPPPLPPPTFNKDDIIDDNNNDDTIMDRMGGSGGKEFLIALLSVLQPHGGICHWYDFCADHEYPSCTRTIQFLSDICYNVYQYDITIIHIAHVGSIAKRQLRICVDFSVSPCSNEMQRPLKNIPNNNI